MQWSRLWILALGTFAVGTDLFVIAGLLPAVARGIHSSPAAAGFLVTVFSVAYAIGSPVLASATGAVPRKRMLILSIGLFALANAFAAAAPNYLWLLAARIAAAFGAALYTPAASSVAVGLAKPEARGRALASVLAGLTVATVLGVPIGTEVGALFSWRMTFVFLAVLGAVAAAGAITLLPDVQTPRPAGLMDRVRVMRRPRVLKTLSLTFLWTMGGFTVYTYLAVFLRHFSDISGAGLSGILLWYGLAAVAGNHAGGAGVDRLGSRRIIGIGLGVLVLVFGALRWSVSTMFGTVASVGLWGVAGWILQPSQQHRLVEWVPDHPSVILALNGSAIYAGIAAGSALGAVLVRQGFVSWLGLAAGGCVAMALALHVLWTRPSAPRVEAPAPGNAGN